MVIELGGSVFEITHDLVGDLFRAKNAGVTPPSATRWYGSYRQRQTRETRGKPSVQKM
jgi:hypothetical protein